jgi:hypothetical protein
LNERTDEPQSGSELEGQYANYFRVGYNAVEFVLDFGQFYLDENRPRLHTRIVTSPVYAKALGETIRDSLSDYERAHGAIPEAGETGAA